MNYRVILALLAISSVISSANAAGKPTDYSEECISFITVDKQPKKSADTTPYTLVRRNKDSGVATVTLFNLIRVGNLVICPAESDSSANMWLSLKEGKCYLTKQAYENLQAASQEENCLLLQGDMHIATFTHSGITKDEIVKGFFRKGIHPDALADKEPLLRSLFTTFNHHYRKSQNRLAACHMLSSIGQRDRRAQR